MNREIKFRAWQSQEKKMYLQGDTVDENRRIFWDIWENKSHISEPMQFIGLRDKNDNDIYEFDICKFYNKYNQTWYTRVVRYCPMLACFGLYPNMEEVWQYEPDWLKISEVEIIGNIYENAEMLNVQPIKEPMCGDGG